MAVTVTASKYCVWWRGARARWRRRWWARTWCRPRWAPAARASARSAPPAATVACSLPLSSHTHQVCTRMLTSMHICISIYSSSVCSVHKLSVSLSISLSLFALAHSSSLYARVKLLKQTANTVQYSSVVYIYSKFRYESKRPMWAVNSDWWDRAKVKTIWIRSGLGWPRQQLMTSEINVNVLR